MLTQHQQVPAELESTLITLHHEFEEERLQLLAERRERQHGYDLGVTPKFEYTHIAKLVDWKVAPIPEHRQDLQVRGLHSQETQFRVSGEPVSAGLFDLTTAVHHTVLTFLADGKAPVFYVPQCEHYQEARWWNRLFQRLEEIFNLPKASLRVMFLIETLPAVFQMEEILYEIRERACGLSGGHWDKIVADINKLKCHPKRVSALRSFPDTSKSWMDLYAKLLIRTCYRHGALAMAGMAALAPAEQDLHSESDLDLVYRFERPALLPDLV